MDTRLKKTDSMALKGIAILLMVFHHCYRTAEKFAGYEINFWPFQEAAVIEYGLYAKICVSLFAFVSGYGLMFGYQKLPSNKNGDAVTKWAATHIFSTVSGYWFVAPLGYIFYGVMNGFSFSNWGDTRFEKLFSIFVDCIGLSGILGTESVNGAWWYIGTAVVFVAMVPVFAFMIDRFGVLICGMLIIISSRILGLGFLGGSTPYSFFLILMLGMISCKYDFFAVFENWNIGKSKRVSGIVKFMAMLILVLFGIWSCRKVNLKIFWEYKYAIIPFILIIFCVEYLFRIPKIKTVLGFLGKHSTNIWLVHTFVRDYLETYVWSVKYFLLVPVVILAISLFISICINSLKRITRYDILIQKAIKAMK